MIPNLFNSPPPITHTFDQYGRKHLASDIKWNERMWTLHATKGWRSYRIPPKRKGKPVAWWL